jgi:hypothetical protein
MRIPLKGEVNASQSTPRGPDEEAFVAARRSDANNFSPPLKPMDSAPPEIGLDADAAADMLAWEKIGGGP